ncbi:MAG TPA: tetratricopeptide repeat protein [Pyrinomonadaceae bacterium]
MKKLTGLTLLTFILSLNSSAQTAQRGAGVSIRNERGQVETVKLYEGSYALVIGVVNYRHWQRLGGVREDVPAVRAALERHGFKVEELLDPTGDVLLSRINKFINDYGLYPDNRLLIYYSGHGYTEVSGDGRKFGYIVPVDAPKPDKDIIGFQQKALTMDEVETFARRIRSKHALFVFDSCFSGTLVNKGGLIVPKVIDYYATRPVRQFITAGADNQEVPAESVFRQVFVRGLEGTADQNNDGYVTGTELATYLQEQVIYYRGEAQTPQYGKIRDPRLDSGDFIFTLPGPPPNVGEHARDLATNALAKLKLGQDDEAFRLANQALSLDDSSALAYAVRGLLSVSRGTIATGLADLKRANQLDERSGVLRSMLSVGYAVADMTELSKTAAEEALRLLPSPKDDTEFTARGIAHAFVRNYESAIADFDKAVGLNPRYFKAFYNRALSHERKGDYDRAIADYSKVIELSPQDANAYASRGILYYEKGKTHLAIADYGKAIELNPQDAEAYYNRALAYQSVGNNGRAIADYSEAIRLNPEYVNAYQGRANVYEKIGDAARARADRNKAAALEGLVGKP